MAEAAPVGARPLRALHIVFRVVFAVALVVLLVLIGIKQAPKVLAAIAPATPTTTVAAGLPTTAVPAPTESTTPIPTISVPTVSIPPISSGGGGGSGGGTSGSSAVPTRSTSTAPVVTSLSAADVQCPQQPSDAPNASPVPDPEATISWSTSGGTEAWFGIQTRDAQSAPYSSEPLSGSISVHFPCTESSQLYTVTVVGAGGNASRSVTVHNIGAVG